jgi:hypothetical protein
LANNIIQQQVNNDRVLPGIEHAVNTQYPGTPLPITKNLWRHERTPEAVAVMEGARGKGGNSLASSQTNLVAPDDSPKHICGTYALISECSAGHMFAKRIYCGKEWCPVCGKKRSAAHNRRIARILPKAMQIRIMGYFVIEFPDALRHVGYHGVSGLDDVEGWCNSKDDLQDTAKRIVDVLAGKRMGNHGRVGGFFKRGLLRWHWFGDEKPGKYNPHANVLVDAGFIPAEKLEEIKQALREALNVPDLIVHYSFVDTPGQMFQKIEYITRATFLKYEWSPYMAAQLFNFRNQRWWGDWKQEPVWGVDALDKTDVDGLLAVGKLQGGHCPDCGCDLKTLYHAHDGHEVKWSKPIDSTWLTVWNAEEIAGTGYYRIPVGDWNGNSISPGEFIRLQELEREAKEKPSVWTVAVLARKHVSQYKTKLVNDSWWADVMAHPEMLN